MTAIWRGLPLSAFALAGFVLLVPFEDTATGLRTTLLWSAAALTIWETRPLWMPSLFGRGLRGAWPLLASGAFLCGCVLLAIGLGFYRGEGGSAATPLNLIRRAGLFIFVFPILMVAVVATRASIPSPLARRCDAVICAAMIAWGAWTVIACAYSLKPKMSAPLLFNEGGAYLLAATVLLLLVRRAPAAGPLLLGWMLAVGTLISLIAAGEFAAGHAGPDSWRQTLLKREAIRESPNNLGERVVRAQGPFDSHNRLASYLLIVAGLVPAGLAIVRSKRGSVLLGLVWVLALLGVALTGTRGALIALAAGLAVALMARPRVLLILIAVGALVFAIFPQAPLRHLKSVFDPQTYARREGTVQYRFTAWRIAGKMIRERPLFGFGYGWKLFESHYPSYTAGEEFYEPDMPHAHNNLIEMTVETGLVGSSLFVLYQGALVFALIALVRGSDPGTAERRLAWALLGLLVATHVYGATNFSLRRSVGFEVWLSWGLAHALTLQGIARRGWDSTPISPRDERVSPGGG